MSKLENKQIVETAIEARGAERRSTVRNMLVWSLTLVVVAFAAEIIRNHLASYLHGHHPKTAHPVKPTQLA
jgi:hypothetical protein